MSILLENGSFTLNCHLHVTSSPLGFKRMSTDIEKDSMTVSIDSYHKKTKRFITVLLCGKSAFTNILLLELKCTMNKCLRRSEEPKFINLQYIEMLRDKVSAKMMKQG